MPSPPVDDLKAAPCPPSAMSTGVKDEYGIADIDDEEITYPEGGLQAWLVVLGSFCGM